MNKKNWEPKELLKKTEKDLNYMPNSDFWRKLLTTINSIQKWNISFLDISMFNNSLETSELNETLNNVLWDFFNISHKNEKNEKQEIIKIIWNKKYPEEYKEFDDNHIWDWLEIVLENNENEFFNYQVLTINLPKKLTKKIKNYLDVLKNILRDKYDFNTNIVWSNNIWAYWLLEETSKFWNMDFLINDWNKQEENNKIIDRLNVIIKKINGDRELSKIDSELLMEIWIKDEKDLTLLLKRLQDKIFDLDIWLDLQNYINISNILENKILKIEESFEYKKGEKQVFESRKKMILEELKKADEKWKSFLQKELISIENQEKNYQIISDTSSFDSSKLAILKWHLSEIEKILEEKISNYNVNKTNINLLEKTDKFLKKSGKNFEKETSISDKILSLLTNIQESILDKSENKKEKLLFSKILQDFINKKYNWVYDEKKFIDNIMYNAKKVYSNKMNLFYEEEILLSELRNWKNNIIYNWWEFDYEELENFNALFDETWISNYNKALHYSKEVWFRNREKFDIISLSSNEFLLLWKNTYLFMVLINESYELYNDLVEENNSNFGDLIKINWAIELWDKKYYNTIEKWEEEEEKECLVKIIWKKWELEYFKIDNEYVIQLWDYDLSENGEDITWENLYEEFWKNKLVIVYIWDEKLKNEKRVLLKEWDFKNEDFSFIKTDEWEKVSKVIWILEVWKILKEKLFKIELYDWREKIANFDWERFYDLKNESYFF